MRLRVRLDAKRAAIEMRYLPPEVKRPVRAALRNLIVDPLGRVPRLDVRRLRTRHPPDLYRLRIGEWRVVYTFDAENLYVFRVFHRSEGYDWMDRLDGSVP